jgi:biopolymer transport protein ExbB
MGPFLKFVVDDWYIAFPMFGMSIAGVAMVVWRLLLNINGNSQLNLLLPALQEKLDKEGVDGALRFCRSRPDLISRKLLAAGLETSKQGLAASKRSMANAAELEILPDLNFLLPSILAIAKIATMVGLLGTVISMINVFTLMADPNASGDAKGQAGKIGLALFATALGLVTAIPLVFSYTLFKGWIAQFEVRMKSAAQKLLLMLQSLKGGKTTAAAAPAAAAKPSPDSASAVTAKR